MLINTWSKFDNLLNGSKVIVEMKSGTHGLITQKHNTFGGGGKFMQTDDYLAVTKTYIF